MSAESYNAEHDEERQFSGLSAARILRISPPRSASIRRWQKRLSLR
jgi:hypothetical protein